MIKGDTSNGYFLSEWYLHNATASLKCQGFVITKLPIQKTLTLWRWMQGMYCWVTVQFLVVFWNLNILFISKTKLIVL